MASVSLKKDKLETAKHDRRDQTDNKTGEEKPELGKRYQEIIEQIKEKDESRKQGIESKQRDKR